jgi:hypothetical protein
MGMFTEFILNVELKKDVPKDILDILKYMIDNSLPKPQLSNHALFETDRWRFMLQSDSHYFDSDAHSTLRYDENSNSYYLNIKCNLKNYNEEIEKFINWIQDYVFTDGFWGYKIYEKNGIPDVIFNGISYLISNPNLKEITKKKGENDEKSY